ncbi:ubiquitin-specific protease [Castilleja foliolosa]|uniref:Ubiquitin-specific protease n=1 Tax=Castilleja foliolosa TaxID=1961234 RepID=A0ABD3D6C3_9LAMI
MVLEMNLGFLCSVLVVLVGWLAGRWKWQLVAARKEEIRRLMMLASEESERAELEAASGYISYGSVLAAEPTMAEELVIGPGLSPGRKLQHGRGARRWWISRLRFSVVVVSRRRFTGGLLYGFRVVGFVWWLSHLRRGVDFLWWF